MQYLKLHHKNIHFLSLGITVRALFVYSLYIPLIIFCRFECINSQIWVYKFPSFYSIEVNVLSFHNCFLLVGGNLIGFLREQ